MTLASSWFTICCFWLVIPPGVLYDRCKGPAPCVAAGVRSKLIYRARSSSCHFLQICKRPSPSIGCIDCCHSARSCFHNLSLSWSLAKEVASSDSDFPGWLATVTIAGFAEAALPSLPVIDTFSQSGSSLSQPSISSIRDSLILSSSSLSFVPLLVAVFLSLSVPFLSLEEDKMEEKEREGRTEGKKQREKVEKQL